MSPTLLFLEPVEGGIRHECGSWPFQPLVSLRPTNELVSSCAGFPWVASFVLSGPQIGPSLPGLICLSGVV